MQRHSLQKQVETFTAAMLFTTPFGVSVGTAGYTTPHCFHSTGNTVYATDLFKTAVDLYSEKLSTLLEEYGLEKQQLAKLLDVSRPTIDSWLDKKVEKIKPASQERLELLASLFNEHIFAELRSTLGHFMKRELEDESKALLSALSATKLDRAEAEKLLETANRRLAGLKRAEELDELLGNNRPAFI